MIFKEFKSQINTLLFVMSSNEITFAFTLNQQFVDTFRNIKPPFGFNGLGELVYQRTYSRPLPNGKKERWADTIERVVNGCYSMQKRWIQLHKLGWSEAVGQKSAQEMFERMFHMKFLPPGRGLWAMGTKITEERGLYAALNNCAFVTTKDMDKNPSFPFCFLFDYSMLGVGVGFDTKGAGTVKVIGPDESRSETFIIADDREGWTEGLRRLIDSYFKQGSIRQEFDFSKIRPGGLPIKTFGGVSSGPDPLKKLYQDVRVTLDKNKDLFVTVRTIADIQNLIGTCVIAGNVRRCLPVGSLVHCRGGLIPIEDVKIGEDVLTTQGYHKVTDWFDQGERDIIRIVTQDGDFVCTENHRMPVLTNFDKYEWIEAGKLEPGNRLISSRTPIEGQVTTLPECVYFTVPDLDEDMAWFLGLFCSANGCADGVDVSVSLGLHDESISEKAAEQLRRFSIDLHVTVKQHPEELKMLLMRCQSKQLAWYFDKYIKTTIRIPDFILRAKNSVRLAYVAGVLDVTETNRPVVINTVHEEFARDIQKVLYSCGIESRLTIQTGHYKVNLITRRAVFLIDSIPQLHKELIVDTESQNLNEFPIQFCADWNWHVKQKINYEDRLKKGHGLDIDYYDDESDYAKLCPVEVIRIEPAGISRCYDITVDGPNESKGVHEFYVNGLLSHNTAEIMLGDPNSDEFLNLKNYEQNPERAMYGWTSNNSIFAEIGMNYSKAAELTASNGEPGYFWLKPTQDYGRMCEPPNFKDRRVTGTNPCCEQSLESAEMCNLVEVFPMNCSDLQDFKRTLKFAYLYAKTVTLGNSHIAETNQVMLRNRRIGCSLTGIAQFLPKYGIHSLEQWCNEGYKIVQYYDEVYSDWLSIPRSVKTTCIKPSGSVSLVAGATPGMHWPESRYYIRRVRLSKNSDMIVPLRKSGYHVEDCKIQPDTTSIVEIPVDVGECRTINDVSMWEQLSMAGFLQKYWADNQVSSTVTFKPEEAKDIQHALNYFQYQLKGVSFLPKAPKASYPQLPYEEISEDEYKRKIIGIKPLDFHNSTETIDENSVSFCDSDSCVFKT